MRKTKKTAAPWGTCKYKGCGKRTRTRQAIRCEAHQKVVRAAQALRNNRTWWKRRDEGKAGHRKKYAGRPTAWARAQRARKAKRAHLRVVPAAA